MSENTKIQWCDHTFNPWIGCTKVSSGCANCYAEELMDKRYGKAKWGKGQPRIRTSAANWKLPPKWNRLAGVEEHSFRANPMQARFEASPWHRPRVFCASLADWLDDEVPIAWLADLLKLIHDTPNLDWLLLTKRPLDFFRRVCAAYNCLSALEPDEIERPTLLMIDAWLAENGHKHIPSNVWIGVSVENQETADRRIPELLKIPARVRFLSVEPMLERIVLPWKPDYSATRREISSMPGIRWVIFGGESGPKARPCNIDWIRDGISQCRTAGVAVFVKQIGGLACFTYEVGTAKGGCLQAVITKDKKGGDPSEWPDDLRVREFPK